jgi:hypothetical protein
MIATVGNQIIIYSIVAHVAGRPSQAPIKCNYSINGFSDAQTPQLPREVRIMANNRSTFEQLLDWRAASAL